ncbi:MAG TPA: hypothetical protein VKY92_13810 [Verrucomicrobiae bacterium]|nr:hypothetical protein [Verrucomicrobiae bacterium]
MKVLLRDEQARLYHGPNDTWVIDPTTATDYRMVERAGHEAVQRPAQMLAVVLRYDNPECELALNPAFCVNKVPVRMT